MNAKVDRFRLLAGRPAGGEASGPIICSCHGVGAGAIRQAIEGGAQTVDAIGKVTCAGTNCGSCKPELKALLEDARRAFPVAAE
ncbi:MAG: (2Fe-2S)-binding protein [Pseudomonadota bacterium]